MIRRDFPTFAASLALAMFIPSALSAQLTAHDLNFGGTGISNTAVATNDSGSIGVLLGLTATRRCYNAPPETCGPLVTNDGIDTFFAQPGEGEFWDPNYLSTWNFDFAAVGENVDDYTYTLFYDTDPLVGNGTTGSFSVPDYCFPVIGCFIGEQDSENLGFFESTFDPNANGQYEFDLIAYDPNGAEASSAQMFVDVGTPESPVPEPATMSLMAMGLVGLAATRRRRKR
ncbi:MAG: PEP-CTERM sorting domain-containing protein [Gemmatimonadales bacterium]